MEVFKVFTVEDVIEGFSAITSYAYRYFETLILCEYTFEVKCSTTTKTTHHGIQCFWLQSFAFVLQFRMQCWKGFQAI